MVIFSQMLFHDVVDAANHCLRAHTCLKLPFSFMSPPPPPSITLQKIQNSVIAFLWKMNFKMIYQPFSPRIFFESEQKGCSVRITVTVTMQISLAGTKQSYTKPAVLTYISQKQLPHLPKNFIKCNQCDYEYIRECNARRRMKTNQAAFTCNAQNQFSVWQQLTNSDDPEWSFPVKKQNSLSSRFFYEYLQTISKGNVLSQINHSLPSPFLFPVSSFIGGDMA